MNIVPQIAKGQLVPLVFGQTDLAVSQTDVQLVVAIGETGQTSDGYVMPFAGGVVGVSYQMTAAPTAGTATVGATIGGTEDADTTLSVTVDSVAVTGYKRVQREAARFVAGDVIGAELTTSAAFAPITADVSVVVWVLANLEGI